MKPASQLITVTLCCSEEDLTRVRSLAAALQRDALDVQIYAGVDLDARVLEQMTEPRSPGVFVLCESVDLDAYQLPELEARFESYRLERDRLVHVNLETDEPKQMLERIRPRVAEIAGEEPTLNPATTKRADISEAIALAQRMARDSAKTQAYRRVSSLPEAPTQTYARVEAGAEDELDIEVDEGEGVELAAGLESSGSAAKPASGRAGVLAVAAGLGVVLVGGLAYLAWAGSGASEGELGARTPEPEPPAQAAATPAEPDVAPAPEQPAPEQPAPEDDAVLANAVEPGEAEQVEAEGEGAIGTFGEPEPAEDPEVLEVVTEPEPEQAAKRDEPLLRVEPKQGEIRKHEGLQIAPVTDYEFAWHDAANHCRLHERGGKTGWRLASIQQLEELHEAGKLEPGRYWSMTLAIVGSTRNFILDTDERGRQSGDKHASKALAQCVRQP